MTETRERFCPHCGRANPVTMPRCMNCGQRVGGTVLLTETSDNPTSAPWWQTSEGSAIPPPPQVREQIARQEAALQEQTRIATEQQKFQERLEVERQRSAERLAAIRERRQARLDEPRITATQTQTTVAAQTTAVNCQRCGSSLGQAGHTFSFCLSCGADVAPKSRTTATMQPANRTTVVAEPRTATRQSVRNLGSNVNAQSQTTQQARSDINPTFPALMSLFFPGIGQFINGQATKGILLLLALFVMTFVFRWGGIFLWLGHGLAALDAYSIARRRREGWNVPEDEWDFGG